jgi:hypothetical protein
MTMLRATLTVLIALIAVAAALLPAPAAAQWSERQQHESNEAFYSRGTGGVPPN